MTIENTVEKKAHHIRVELVIEYKNEKHWPSWMQKKTLIQSKPFDLILKFTNIGKEPTPQIKVTNFQIKSSNTELRAYTANSLVVPLLNINESKKLFLDNFDIRFKDSVWISLDMVAVNEDCTVIAYQHDKHHCSDQPYRIQNHWGNTEFVHGEMETLQQKTNQLVLILTAVTVIESLFGMKIFIKFLAGLIYQPLHYIAEFIGTLIQ